MKLLYKGTGTVFLEGIGEVKPGDTVEVPLVLGQDLLKRDDWSQDVAALPREPGPKAARDKKGGGD